MCVECDRDVRCKSLHLRWGKERKKNPSNDEPLTKMHTPQGGAKFGGKCQGHIHRAARPHNKMIFSPKYVESERFFFRINRQIGGD